MRGILGELERKMGGVDISIFHCTHVEILKNKEQLFKNEVVSQRVNHSRTLPEASAVSSLRACPTPCPPSHLTMGSLVKGTGGSVRPSGSVMGSMVPGHLAV